VQGLPAYWHFITSELKKLGISCVSPTSFVWYISVFKSKIKPSCSPAQFSLRSMGPRSPCCGSGHCCICSGWPAVGDGQAHACWAGVFSAEPTRALILADATEHYCNAINTPAASAYVLYAVSSMLKANLKGNAYIEGKVYCGNSVTAHRLYPASVTGEQAPEPAVTSKRTPGFIFLIPDKNDLASVPAHLTATADTGACV